MNNNLYHVRNLIEDVQEEFVHGPLFLGRRSVTDNDTNVLADAFRQLNINVHNNQYNDDRPEYIEILGPARPITIVEEAEPVPPGYICIFYTLMILFLIIVLLYIGFQIPVSTLNDTNEFMNDDNSPKTM